MKILIFFQLILASAKCFALITGPSSLDTGKNYLSISLQSERGKIEPNENKSSYQEAQIDILKLKYSNRIDGLFSQIHTKYFFEFGSFTSAQEKVGNSLFYEQDKGAYLTIGFSLDLLNDLDKHFGTYFQISPFRRYNSKKFSNPRFDTAAFGLTSSFNVTDSLFQKNLIHIGFGDGTHQNSYLAIDTGLGYRLIHLIGQNITLLGSLFVEVDTAERNDLSYDQAFSPPGQQDRIRSAKYGTVLGIDSALTNEVNLSLNILQKLGGYDARSTQILNLNLGYKF